MGVKQRWVKLDVNIIFKMKDFQGRTNTNFFSIPSPWLPRQSDGEVYYSFPAPVMMSLFYVWLLKNHHPIAPNSNKCKYITDQMCLLSSAIVMFSLENSFITKIIALNAWLRKREKDVIVLTQTFLLRECQTMDLSENKYLISEPWSLSYSTPLLLMANNGETSW